MSNFSRTFGNQSSPIPLSYLDDNFSQLESASTSTVTLAGAALVGFVQSGTGAITRAVQDVLRERVRVLDFIPVALHAGIKARTDTTDLATYIAAADLYAGSIRATLEFDDGRYFTSSLTKKFAACWRGKSPLNYVVGASTSTGAELRLADSTNAPMISNDRDNGDTGGTGIDGVANKATYCTFENLAFDGNRTNNSSVDADIIRLTGAWSTTFKGCLFRNSRGFGIRALDCNLLHILDCHTSAAPIFLESAADCLIRGNQLGGSNSPIYPVLWISGNGEAGDSGGWQNVISGNFVFNNANNTAITQPTISSISSNEITLSGAHGWTNKTPVVVNNSGGALPTGLSAGTTYYVTSTASDKIKLSLSRELVDAGTFVACSGGSGTNTVGVGENCNIYVNHQAKWNTFTGNRIDQAYGHGFLLRETDENTFTGNVVNSSGLGNASAVSGFALRSATKNVFSGNTVNGTTVTVGATNSNQTIGFDGDSGSTGNRGDLGNQSMNHSTADVSMTAGYTINAQADERFFHVRDFGAIAGTPAVGLDAGSRREMWLFDQTTDELIGTWFQVPVGWTKFTTTLYWVNAGAGSGDVFWAISGREFAATETINAADDLTANFATITAAARDVITASTFSSGTYACTAGKLFNLRIKRTASDGADTLGNDAGVLGIKLTRA